MRFVESSQRGENIMEKISVKFIKVYPPYMVGEVATFFSAQANRLIDRGFAVYAGGDNARETAADRLKALRGAPNDRAIHGPAATKHIPGPDAVKSPSSTGNLPGGTSTAPGQKDAGKMEGNSKTGPKVGGPGRKCGLCGKPGHTRTNCPAKKK